MRISPDRAAYVRRCLVPSAEASPGAEPKQNVRINASLSSEQTVPAYQLGSGVESLEQWLDLNA